MKPARWIPPRALTRAELEATDPVTAGATSHDGERRVVYPAPGD